MVFGSLFLFAGFYLIIRDYLSGYYSPLNSRAFFVGIGGIALGLAFIWRAIRWVQSTDPKLQPKTNICPHCGALIDKNDVQCKKCGKPLQ
jgi:hypothetical protein